MGMKEDFIDLNVEELQLNPVSASDDEEILTGNNVFNPHPDDVEAIDEVRSDEEDEIVVGEIATGDDWQRAIKHLNVRIGELEREVERLAEKIEELKKGK